MLTTTSTAQQQTTDIPLYLPYQSSQYPELALKLDSALAEAGLGQFKTVTTDYWHPYQQGIRQGRIGVYLAAPHYTAWALHKHRFIPFLRLPNSLQYVIATRHADSQYFEVNDLAGQNICSQRAVNLDFLLVQQAFDQPLKTASNKFVNSVASAMQYDNQNCAAFAVTEHTFKRFNTAEPDRFIRLLQGPEYRNYAFIAHPDIARDTAIKLKRFLRSATAITILTPLLKQFSSSPSLLPVRRADYPKSYLSILAPYWG
ncbi:phosphate/phosphite/phosphonate ABC transporter substrate-binding protein [Arenicella xantha]|uniref:ABC-type phosphate/phosphonate transport system substrate-binding protein n=1 Tax=Arenicella xantha TaxID=644221 RepID=A0A395JNJ0_9GAMM|nr:phosphate/phosphite/phosphonate ABC transporter substrate-binding protein [Arenicella xantha]RBP49634.1 hypothetical protein DFR28_10359 [Arenicella xantha]